MSFQQLLASMRASITGSADPRAEQEWAAILRRLRDLHDATTPNIVETPIAQAQRVEVNRDGLTRLVSPLP